MNEQVRGPSMLALVSDLNGSALWRVLWPMTALQRAGYRAEWDSNAALLVGALSVSPASPFDGYVLPRMSWPTAARPLALRWIEAIHDAGRFLVYDLDDDMLTSSDTYRRIELGLTSGKTFDQLEAERADRLWALRQCDGVTVSTKHLAAIVRSFTARPVIVVPNAIDVPWFRSVVRATRRQIPGITIGWAGGARADRDVEAMAEAWGRIAARYPGVRFIVQGHVPEVIVDEVWRDRLAILPWMSLERYPCGLAQVDIACCSVGPTWFNASKSPIKAMEAALAGSAVVATPTLYGQLVEHDVTGLLATTVDEWETALAALVERPSYRAILARRLVRHVERRWSLTENLGAWPAAWQTIAEDARSRRGRLVTV
jgi:glycosyltransferase involved in cell wall biosynthesis